MATKKQKAAVAAPKAPLEAAGRQTIEAVTKALMSYDQLAAVGKDNLDAVLQANAAAVAGAQRLNTVFAAYLETALEANLAASKALTGVKTVQEAVELQTSHTRATLDSALTKGVEISEVALAVANDVAGPLQAQTKVALDKLLKPLAA